MRENYAAKYRETFLQTTEIYNVLNPTSFMQIGAELCGQLDGYLHFHRWKSSLYFS